MPTLDQLLAAIDAAKREVRNDPLRALASAGKGAFIGSADLLDLLTGISAKAGGNWSPDAGTHAGAALRERWAEPTGVIRDGELRNEDVETPSAVQGAGELAGLPIATGAKLTLAALSKAAPAALALMGGIRGVDETGKTAAAQFVKRSRRVVGTTGQYVGAPPGVDSPAALGNIVRRYLDAMESGAPGRVFYKESSADVLGRTGGNTDLADSVVANLSATSRRQQVGGNTALGVRGHSQAMTGQPIESVGLPGNAEAVAEAYGPERNYLGHKREPFAEQLSVAWAPERIGRGVNDMHEAEIMGYPPDVSLGPTNHAFMDEVRDRAIRIANERKLGGFDDWDTGTAQAAAWTGNKIRRGEVKVGDAAKTYAYYLPRAEANATYESLPGLGVGHLPKSAEASFAEKQAFHDDPRGNWTNEYGRDVLYTKTGLLPGPDVPAVGRFGQEVNPATVSRPVVAMEPGGAAVAPYSKDALDTVEAFRAYMDAQNAGAWHKIVGSKAPEYNVAGVPVENMSEDLMKQLAPLFEQKGYGVASAPRGMSIMSFGGEAPTGEAFAKDVRSTLKSAGQERPELGKMESGYIDYSNDWGGPPGTATRHLLDQLDKSPVVAGKLDDPAIRAAVAGKNERDAAFPQWGAPRDDIKLAREIYAASGITGLREALASGKVVLPSSIAALLAAMPDDDERMQ